MLGMKKFQEEMRLIKEYANISFDEGKLHESERRWITFLSRTKKAFDSPDAKLAYSRLNHIYRQQGMHEKADNLLMPEEHRSRIKFEIENSGILSASKDVTIIIVSQIELSPYISAFLRKFGNRLSGSFLILHRHANDMSKEFLLYSSRCYGIDIGHFSQWTENKIIILKNAIESSGKKIACLVAHPFERISGITVNYFLEKFMDLKYIFYSDGSRNNKESEEHTKNIKGASFKKALLSDFEVWLCEFGFSSSSQIVSNNRIQPKKHILVEYQWLDFCFSQTKIDLLIKKTFEGKNKEQLHIKKSALILNRYWGRGPYMFDSDDLLTLSMSSSIYKACRDAENIILRKDSRCHFSTDALISSIKSHNKFKTITTLEDIIKPEKGEIKDLIFEYIIHKTRDFFENIKYIYSFDSSFPLVFLSPMLMRKLNPEVKFIVGFDYSSVKRYGTDECLRVMSYRVAVLIEDVLMLSLFSVSDSLGSVFNGEAPIDCSKNRELLLERIKNNGGYFFLQKNKN